MNDRLKEAFGKVHAEEELKARTKRYISQEIYSQRKAFFGKYRRKAGRPTHGQSAHRRIVAVLACFFLILFGSGSYFSYFTPTSAISLDINPSIELEINRYHKVIFIKGYNEDGQNLASSLNIRFLDYQDALGRILNDEDTARYLEEDAFVSITVSGQGSEEMLANVASCTESFYADVHCSHSTQEEVIAAHEAGMSFGKYRAYLELKELDETIRPEDIQELSMCQIEGLIYMLSNGVPSKAEAPEEALPEETPASEEVPEEKPSEIQEDEPESLPPRGRGSCHGHGHH